MMVKNLSKGAELILHVLRMTGPVTKTKLMKLLFLIDYESSKRIGKKISDFSYVKYFYGPYSPAVEDCLKELSINRDIYYDENISASGRKYFLIIPVPTDEGDNMRKEKDLFPKDQENIIREVIEKYGDKDLEEILSDVYSLEEVKNKGFGEEIL